MTSGATPARGDREALDLVYVLVDPQFALDNSPVFQSQILDWVRLQRQGGLRVGIVCSVADDGRFERLVAAPLREHGVPFLAFPDGTLRHNLARGARLLRKLVREHRARHVYARGIWGAYAHRLAFPLGGPPLVYDFRGDLVAEAEMRGASPLRLAVLRALCRGAFSRARTLLCVSTPAAETLAREYGRPGAVVIPSLVDADWFRGFQDRRREVRASLGVGDEDVLLVYAGGLNPYQMLPEMLRVWKGLSGRPDVRFLLLLARQQPTGGERPELDGAAEIPGLVTLSVPRHEVPGYLAASDVGFLLRQEHPLNRVASPVKFGEYLSSGLAIVTSPGVGDISRIVEEHDLGILVRPEDTRRAVAACAGLVARVREERDAFRRRAFDAVVREKWDWKAHLGLWTAIIAPGRGPGAVRPAQASRSAVSPEAV
ncbi:MAG TPA: glycosyltransferase [Longimicrobiaceae bacterium]|nr:glycosyltransferase [Longimicrobiaceae bacterium]